MFQNEPALARPEQSFPPQVLFHLAPDFPWEGMRAMAKLNAVIASVVDSPRMAGGGLDELVAHRKCSRNTFILSCTSRRQSSDNERNSYLF